MILIRDTVKVIGKTIDVDGIEKELIPIGTICRVVDSSGRYSRIVPLNNLNIEPYWYEDKDLEKGRLEWVKS